VKSFKSKTKVATTVLCGALTAITSANVSADRFEDQVQIQLSAAEFLFNMQGGYERTHDAYLGRIYPRDSYSDVLTLRLYRGTSYAIMGFCDQDCGDIDLKLYDDNGNLISSDTEIDDKPIITASPRWNAEFTLKVTIPSCSSVYCAFGIGVFGK